MAAADEEPERMNKRNRNRRFPPAVTRLPKAGLLVDLGPQPRAGIMRLAQGQGELARQVQAAVLRSREQLGIDPAAEIVPVVLLYRCPRFDYVIVDPKA